MKIRTLIKRCLMVVLSLCLLSCWSFTLPAAESRGEAAVGKELEKDIGMPVLDGDLWQKMTHDDKIAFVWGLWTVVSIEYYLTDRHPDLRRENFSAKIYEASHKKPKTANEIVAMIDTYYQTNPDETEKPVIAVLWDSMIKPNITTGIAGRPLKP